MKFILKSLLARTGYRMIRQSDMNRFQAIDACMHGLAERAYRPRVIIDGGAHVGQFAVLARKSFAGAEAFHLFEPQQACLPQLRKLCAREGFILHECALSSQSGTLRFASTDRPSTGASVVQDDAPASEVVACTLDEVLAGRLEPGHRSLLKLDLQGHELDALRGGEKLLHAVEVVLIEAYFYSQSQSRVSAAMEVIAFMGSSGFVLYDIASLSGRPRDNRLREADFVFVRQNSQLLADCQWD